MTHLTDTEKHLVLSKLDKVARTVLTGPAGESRWDSLVWWDDIVKVLEDCTASVSSPDAGQEVT